MQFPDQLWPDSEDRELVRQAVQLFESIPLILTDELTNTAYFNGRAEELFGEPGEAVVNRTAYSVLGYGDGGHAPEGLAAALLGKSGPFRSIMRIAPGGGEPQPVFFEASAIARGTKLVCGLLRFSTERA